MKKFARTLAVLVAAAATVVAVSAPVSAVAVASIEQKGAPEASSAVDGTGASITINVEASTEYTGSDAATLTAALSEVKAASSVNDLAEVSSIASAAGVSVSNLVVKDLFDVWTTASYNGTVTVSLKANLPANAFYIVLHRNNGVWEVVGNGNAAADGSVTFTTSSFSPFAIVTTAESAKTSPQTGEGVNVAVYAAIALAASAVVVACRKKAS